MHTMRSIMFSATALALALGTAQAADKARGNVPNFNQMDKNNDGALTRSEAAGNPRLLAHFKQVDNDGDGKLSRAEYLAIMARQDLHTLRENVAEFVDPEGKAPLATGAQAGQTDAGAQRARAEVPAMAASDQLIRSVQQQLQAKGVDAGPVDGIWGPKTHAGLREFQRSQGLQPSGQLNARTLATLGIASEQTASGTGGAAAGGTSPGASK